LSRENSMPYWNQNGTSKETITMSSALSPVYQTSDYSLQSLRNAGQAVARVKPQSDLPALRRDPSQGTDMSIDSYAMRSEPEPDSGTGAAFTLSGSGANHGQGISCDQASEILAGGPLQATPAWQFETGPSARPPKAFDAMIKSSPCVGPDGIVYVGSDDRKVYALKDGRKLWEFKTGGEIFSSPCIGPDGIVYIGSDDHKVYALKDGKKFWEYETGGPVKSAPCLGPDGTLYVAGDDRTIYAIPDPRNDISKYLGAGDEEYAPGTGDHHVDIDEDEGWIIIDGIKLPVNKGGVQGPHEQPSVGQQE